MLCVIDAMSSNCANYAECYHAYCHGPIIRLHFITKLTFNKLSRLRNTSFYWSKSQNTFLLTFSIRHGLSDTAADLFIASSLAPSLLVENHLTERHLIDTFSLRDVLTKFDWLIFIFQVKILFLSYSRKWSVVNATPD